MGLGLGQCRVLKVGKEQCRVAGPGRAMCVSVCVCVRVCHVFFLSICLSSVSISLSKVHPAMCW